MASEAGPAEYAERRRAMVDQQLRARGIRDERVLWAMGRIPREEFVLEADRDWAYADEPVGIGHGQTISQPYITALMVESLELKETDSVLEVGAGSGYHAAVLGAIASRVVTIELVPELAEMARRNLERTGLGGNILVVEGDGSLGYLELAPYDAISVAAAPEVIPQALIDQMTDSGGRMVIPVGEAWDQDLVVLRKIGGRISRRVAAHCRFVPLR